MEKGGVHGAGTGHAGIDFTRIKLECVAPSRQRTPSISDFPHAQMTRSMGGAGNGTGQGGSMGGARYAHVMLTVNIN